MEIFVPDVYQKSIYDINYKKLKKKGIKCLLFDLDNTIAPYAMSVPDNKIKDLFAELEDDFKVIIMDNYLNIVNYLAIGKGVPCLLYSYEMSRKQIKSRLINICGDETYERLQDGIAPIYVEDDESLQALASKVLKHKLNLVFLAKEMKKRWRENEEQWEKGGGG